MADSGGHWLNLAEAEKLTQSFLVPGVVEQNLKRGGLLSVFPLAQATGLDIQWNRSNADQTATLAAIGDTLTWTDAVTYDKQTTALRTVYIQTPLNKFVESIYGSINNYHAQQLIENKRAVVRKLEDLLIYGDVTYNTSPQEFDGLHARAEDNGNDTGIDADAADLDIDMGEGALSLTQLRVQSDIMKAGIDFYLMPLQIARRIDAWVQEAGIGTPIGSVSFSVDQMGKKVTHWDGVPIVRSDFMVAEQANTGVGTDARAKNTSGTKQYSIFAIKMGQVMEKEPGLTLAFGGAENEPGEMFRMDFFDKLEDFDASGMRLVSYLALLDGSMYAVGRIFDITDAAVVA